LTAAIRRRELTVQITAPKRPPMCVPLSVRFAGCAGAFVSSSPPRR